MKANKDHTPPRTDVIQDLIEVHDFKPLPKVLMRHARRPEQIEHRSRKVLIGSAHNLSPSPGRELTSESRFEIAE